MAVCYFDLFSPIRANLNQLLYLLFLVKFNALQTPIAHAFYTSRQASLLLRLQKISNPSVIIGLGIVLLNFNSIV